MTGTTVVRIVLGVVGLAMLLGGLALAAVGGGAPEAFVGAFWLITGGAVLLITALIEVTRYRSEQAERARLEPGPGGGEAKPVEPRFRPTDEIFVDPTTQLRMRVYLDPATGDRRYVAEA